MKTTWVIDPDHSEIFFKVKHLVIATVTGSFERFEGKMVTQSDNFEDADVEFSADVDSINTNAPDRDKHLRSDDFFDAAHNPKIFFKSKSFKKSGDAYKLTGDITIRGISREVVLDVEYGGAMKDPWGNDKVGFELTGKLNRKDFGLKWNVMTEAGGAVAGDEVKLQLSVELVKQAA
ncbi:MAG TPA: YceI family protein [Bacteroidales bacterium]|nr:YceI family protein [Bacteroidales bacterium]